MIMRKRWTAAFFLAALATGGSLGLAREKWPSPDRETVRRQAEMKRLDDEAWHKAEPEVLRQAREGKPFIPQAERPDDLPQASIPAFPGAEGAGRFSFGGRGGRVCVVTSL